MAVQPLEVPLVGGRKATLTRAVRGFPRFVALRIEGGGMPPYTNQEWAPGLPSARKAVARDSNLDETSVAFLSEQAMQWVQQVTAEEESAASAAPVIANAPYGLIHRLISQPASEGTAYGVSTPEEVVQLLKRGGFQPNTVLEWGKENLDRLAILDLDFHDVTKPKPTQQELEFLGEDLSPAPWCWWRTHGGGLKALYAPIPHAPYTAIELAAGAAAQCLTTPFVVTCGGTAELIARTRHPMATHNGRSCGPVRETCPTDRFIILQRFSAAGATEEEIADLMEDQGLVLGQRLDHSFCIIDPDHPSKSPPVIVGENGLYCHSCSGRGLGGFMSWGSIRKRFGMAPSLADSEVAPIMTAVKHLVHFKHVDYLMDVYAPELPSQYRPVLYSALLKNQHNTNGIADPRIAGVFNEFGFVRGYGEWLHAATLMPLTRPLNQADVAVLPSTRVLDADGEQIPSQTRISKYTNNGSLDGWTPIQPARFVPIFGHYNTPMTKDHAVLCKPHVVEGRKQRVSYLPLEKRLSRDLVEQRITEYFPGISFTYMAALIIAMGCAESGMGPVPILWATGPTGAAKTTTASIVLSMFGEEFQNLSEVKEDRLDQLFGESLDMARLVLFDDFAKEPEDYKRLHTFFIRINRSGHSYHKLHFGMRTMPVNSAVLLTDWRKPEFFVNESQFGRRVHMIHLDQLPVSWEKLKRRVEGWWTRTEEMREAAESFFSYIVDDFFPDGDSESFSDKMARLDVPRVVDERNAMGEERVGILDLVYDLVSSIVMSTPMSPVDERRIGRGCREIGWSSEQAIGKACTSLIATLGNVKLNAENLNHVLDPFKADLQRMFDLRERSTFHIKEHGSKTFIRIIQDGVTANSDKLINEQLFKLWPPPATGIPRPMMVDVEQPKLNGHANGNGHAHLAVETAPVIKPTGDFSQYQTMAAGAASASTQPQRVMLPTLPGIPTNRG
jgi:hypothetical protein